MTCCLKICLHHLLGHWLHAVASPPPLRSAPAPPWQEKPVAARYGTPPRQGAGLPVAHHAPAFLESSRVATRNRRPVRVYVRRVPGANRPTCATRASAYARAAVTFLLDDEVYGLYAFLLGW